MQDLKCLRWIFSKPQQNLISLVIGRFVTFPIWTVCDGACNCIAPSLTDIVYSVKGFFFSSQLVSVINAVLSITADYFVKGSVF